MSDALILAGLIALVVLAAVAGAILEEDKDDD